METTDQPIEKTEQEKAQDLVLSQQEVQKTEEQKQQARDAFSRRQQQKNWRQQIHEVNANSGENALKAAKAAVQGEVDLNDEATEKNIRVMTKVVRAEREDSEKSKREVLRRASSDILSSTLHEIGVDPTSGAGVGFGNHLFKKFGIENPDFYENTEAVEAERQAYVRSLGKAESPVTSALLNRGSAPGGSKESRTVGAEKGKAEENRRLAGDRGISEAKVSKILELEAKLPAHMRRK